MATQIKLRRDTDANWTANSTVVLGEGEIGVNLTNGQFKLGNGTSTWAQLTYFQPGAPEAASINNFGEGFSLTDDDKIVTNKLYNNDITQPTQRYRLELTSTGVIVLPDQSIINGSTIRGVAGTGELNYTGITIGPNSNDPEKTWMWVDHENAYVSTNNSANTWTFGNDGTLTFPNNSKIVPVALDGLQIDVGTEVWDFGADGSLTLPAGGLIKNSDGTTYGGADLGDISFYDTTMTSTASLSVESGNSVFIKPLDGDHSWQFGVNGTLENSGTWTKTTMTDISSGVGSQVVWTSTEDSISGAKLTIQVEANEPGGLTGWDTQMCEAIIAVRGHATNSIPVISVYGVTHTSVAPLMTFTVDRNPVTSLIEITGTRTETATSAGGASLRIYSVETGTMD